MKLRILKLTVGLLVANFLETFQNCALRQYEVVLRKDDHADLAIILNLLSLGQDNPHLHHVYDNPGFQGFSADLTYLQTVLLQWDPTVLFVFDTDISKLSGQPHTQSPALMSDSETGYGWGLEFISTDNTFDFGYDSISQTESEEFYRRETQFSYDHDPTALGQGVDIYMWDSPIYTKHEAFEGRARMIDESGKTVEPGSHRYSPTKHGTATAGVAAGRYGVAREASIIGLTGKFDTANYDLLAIDFIINQHVKNKQMGGSEYKGSIISRSMGSFPNRAGGDAFLYALKQAMAQGVHYTNAAGNTLPNESRDACQRLDPQLIRHNDNPALIAGMLKSNGQIADGSLTGPCINIWAPGEHILVPSPPFSGYIRDPFSGTSNNYAIASGTSFSAPMVAGLMACAMKNQTLADDPWLMKQHILNNAEWRKVSVTPDMVNQASVIPCAKNEVAAAAARAVERMKVVYVD